MSVLLKIELKHRKNFFIYHGSDSAYPEEQEVILQEGLKFKILSYEVKEEENWKYYEVHLVYDAEIWRIKKRNIVKLLYWFVIIF